MLWRRDAAGICRSSSHREMISSQLRGKLPNFGDFVEGAKKLYIVFCVRGKLSGEQQGTFSCSTFRSFIVTWNMNMEPYIKQF